MRTSLLTCLLALGCTNANAAAFVPSVVVRGTLARGTLARARSESAAEE